MAPANDRDVDALVLLDRPWVHALLLVVSIFVAFGPALEGVAVWDDELTVGAARDLPSLGSTFSTPLFGEGARSASYYRPLVSASFWIGTRLFAGAPHVGLHLENLLWHAAASVLVLYTLRRWLEADRALKIGAVCLAATLLWAVVPQKAENVAWISGRGDAMGLTFLLAGLALRARLRGAAGVACAALGVALALLCKESFVIGPIVIAVELWFEREQRGDRSSPGQLARAPELLATGGLVGSYLVLRALWLPLSGGGAAMFAGLSPLSRAQLFFETVGYGALGMLRLHDASLLMGPIGFRSPSELLHEPAMAGVGVVTIVGAGVLAQRVWVARPALLLLLTLLPVSNLVPSGLESRMSDRFLYVPTLALALGFAIALLHKRETWFRPMVAGLLAGSLLLVFGTRARSAQFVSDDALFSSEIARGNQATSVLVNGARAAAQSLRFREARDLHLRLVERYPELGFAGEGYDDLISALRMQVALTGESHPDSMLALHHVLSALATGPAPDVDFPLGSERKVKVSLSSPQALEYGVRRSLQVRTWGAQLEARMARSSGLATARELVSECPDCPDLLVETARVALISGEPDLALEWLSRAAPGTKNRDELLASAELSRAYKARGNLAAALFVGQAFVGSCLVARKQPPAGPPAVAELACYLAGTGEPPTALSQDGPQEAERLTVLFRNSPKARGDYVVQELGQP